MQMKHTEISSLSPASAAVSSAVQSFDKLKALLEDAEREWANPPPAISRPDFPLNRNHRTKRLQISAARLSDNQQSLKLSSGERRILTALAQYPQGRSKVRVAILSGYAPNGAGFNNYLGGLRTRGFIQGNGDRLTITQAGIQALGSWEPLPTGAALIDYWRGRLGKAERLIVETLTQVFPDLRAEKKWPPRPATKRTAAASITL